MHIAANLKFHLPTITSECEYPLYRCSSLLQQRTRTWTGKWTYECVNTLLLLLMPIPMAYTLLKARFSKQKWTFVLPVPIRFNYTKSKKKSSNFRFQNMILLPENTESRRRISISKRYSTQYIEHYVNSSWYITAFEYFWGQPWAD